MSNQEASKRSKTRNLGIHEFFITLQTEWIQADLRHKIYPSLKDKAYWEKVKAGKKESIDRIADRNNLPTIFTDTEMMRELEKKVYRTQSYPLFTYKDEAHKAEQEYYDLMHYYAINSDVRCEVFDETIVGVIVSYEPYDANAVVNIQGKKQNIPVAKITRIL